MAFSIDGHGPPDPNLKEKPSSPAMGGVEAFPPSADSEEETVEDLLKEADNLRKCAQLVSSLGQRVTPALLGGPCLWFDATTSSHNANLKPAFCLPGCLVRTQHTNYGRKCRYIAANGARLDR